ncbi:uncharacterized protein [Mytilus edulis]|uniref:uncharacterized protein n=1 Tax=Mytilus edulis TaxID=6550 RepID=UPI0039EE1477
MKTIFFFDLIICSVLLVCVLQSVNTAVTTRTPTTHKPTREPDVNHGLYFHYNSRSIEHLLIIQFDSHYSKDCYVMPLSNDDVQTIQDRLGLHHLEEFMMQQLAKKQFILWTHDDFEVRDARWEHSCHQGNIYRVYRV